MFNVGQRVVCVKDPLPGHGCPYPVFKKGSIYTVASIDVFEDETFITAVELHPLVSGEVSGFRPIISRPTSIAVFEEILRKVNAPGRVTA